MKSAERRGEKRGKQLALKEVVARMAERNMNPEEIADLLGIETEKIDGFMEELKRDK